MRSGKKSGILHDSVAHVPVTDVMQESQRYALVDPETVGWRSKIDPEPPALWIHQPMVASAATGAAMSFVTKR